MKNLQGGFKKGLHVGKANDISPLPGLLGCKSGGLMKYKKNDIRTPSLLPQEQPRELDAACMQMLCACTALCCAVRLQFYAHAMLRGCNTMHTRCCVPAVLCTRDAAWMQHYAHAMLRECITMCAMLCECRCTISVNMVDSKIAGRDSGALNDMIEHYKR
eukprot:scaffold55356_cov26-Tisochrysis_lutea.AAC.5